MGIVDHHATTISPSVPHQEEHQQLQGLLPAAADHNSILADDNTLPIELKHLAVLLVDQLRGAAAVLQLLAVAAVEVVAVGAAAADPYLRRDDKEVNDW